MASFHLIVLFTLLSIALSQPIPAAGFFCFTLRCFTQTVPDGALGTHIVFVNSTNTSFVMTVDGYTLVNTSVSLSATNYIALINLVCGKSVGPSYSLSVNTLRTAYFYKFAGQTEPDGEYVIHNLTAAWMTLPTTGAVFIDNIAVYSATVTDTYSVAPVMVGFASLGTFYIAANATIP